MVKLSDFIINYLKEQGLERIFLLPGGGCMHLVDSVGKSGIKFHTMLHEQAVAVAADGYAQYKKDFGVALVTTGPGGTNAITGIAGSWIDSTPLLVLSGQAKRKDLQEGRGVRQMGIQEVDIISLVKPITKYAVTVKDPDQILYYLQKALYLAKEGRPGPVWLDIPLDVQGAIIDETKLKSFVKPKEQKKKINKSISKIYDLLNQSKRPVILAGKGISLANADEKFLELVEQLQIPVLTTWREADLMPENHNLYFGRPGSIASRYANFIQQNSDFIMVMGSRLDLPQVGHNYDLFARKAKKVIIDIDPNEIKKVSSETNIDLAIEANTKDVIEEILKNLNMKDEKDRKEWLSQCETWKEKYPIVLEEYKNQNQEYVNTYAFIDFLSEELDENDVFVPESSGLSAEITPQVFRIKKGQRYINSPGLGSMGFGLPQSIGVCLASNEKRTITLIGDGSLQHNIQELQTVSCLKIPLKIFILNNNGYSSIRITHNKFFEGRLVGCDPSSGLTFPNVQKIAKAYEIPFYKIEGMKDLQSQLEKVLKTEGPVICEIMANPELQIIPKLSSYAKKDGSMASKPLEDLFPFLDRNEFKENMIIEILEED